MHALHALHTGYDRRIDWAPAEDALRALLDGTQLFAFPGVLDLLTTTADPAWIRSVLLPGWQSRIALQMLHSINPADRQRARRFLTAVHGTDLGHDPEPWGSWLRRMTGV
jgi:hypothetical protein